MWLSAHCHFSTPCPAAQKPLPVAARRPCHRAKSLPAIRRVHAPARLPVPLFVAQLLCPDGLQLLRPDGFCSVCPFQQFPRNNSQSSGTSTVSILSDSPWAIS